MSLDEEFREKARAIVLAQHAKEDGDTKTAATLFRRAAELEDRIFEELARSGRKDFLVNALSAVSCWTNAGESNHAMKSAARALSLTREAGLKDIPEKVLGRLRELLRVAAANDSERWRSEKRSEKQPDTVMAPSFRYEVRAKKKDLSEYREQLKGLVVEEGRLAV